MPARPGVPLPLAGPPLRTAQPPSVLPLVACPPTNSDVMPAPLGRAAAVYRATPVAVSLLSVSCVVLIAPQRNRRAIRVAPIHHSASPPAVMSAPDPRNVLTNPPTPTLRFAA